MNNVADEQTTNSQTENESHSRLKISNMLLHLYEAAEPNLSDEELELMSGIAGHAQLQAKIWQKLLTVWHR